MFDYFIHSLYTVINTQRGCHTLKLFNISLAITMTSIPGGGLLLQQPEDAPYHSFKWTQFMIGSGNLNPVYKFVLQCRKTHHLGALVTL